VSDLSEKKSIVLERETRKTEGRRRRITGDSTE
jgi:hypothetical protein